MGRVTDGRRRDELLKRFLQYGTSANERHKRLHFQVAAKGIFHFLNPVGYGFLLPGCYWFFSSSGAKTSFAI